MTTPHFASTKQAALITKLGAEKDWKSLALDDRSRVWMAQVIGSAGGGSPIPARHARLAIDALLKMPRQSRAYDGPEQPQTKTAEEGYYVFDGDIYVVVKSKQDADRHYAKRLHFITARDGSKRPKWIYSPGMSATLGEGGLEPLTPERAAELGHLHGFCIFCCRPLSDPDSVRRGMGRHCAKKRGWA
jgi:hypothetical protein